MILRIVAVSAALCLLLTGCSSDDSSKAERTDTGTAVSETVPNGTAPSGTGAPAEEDPALKYKAAKEMNQHIIEAFRSGDSSGLSEPEAKTLAAAQELIESCTGDDMSAVDKELAIHDELARQIYYDYENLNPMHEHTEHSADSYGALVEHQAICTGYAESFSLLMNLIGIDSMVVNAHSSTGEEHAWSLLRLDGEWYACDMTWDDNHHTDLSVRHRFFNVTDSVMEKHDHKWDKGAYPAAAGTKYSYAELYSVEVNSSDELRNLISGKVSERCCDLFIRPGAYFGNDVTAESFKKEKLSEVSDILSGAGLVLKQYEIFKTSLGNVLRLEFDYPNKDK